MRFADRGKVIKESVGQKIFCVFEQENACLKFVDIQECECAQIGKQGRSTCMVTTMRLKPVSHELSKPWSLGVKLHSRYIITNVCRVK